jgi:hypothetical protein
MDYKYIAVGLPFANLPIFRYIFLDRCGGATLAQLVEQCFRKAKVPGPNPGGGSKSGILLT